MTARLPRRPARVAVAFVALCAAGLVPGPAAHAQASAPALTFAAAPPGPMLPGGGSTSTAVIAPFTGGPLDVVIVDNSGAIAFYPGDGHGDYGPVQTSNVAVLGDTGIRLSTGDFNGDGKLDVLVAVGSGINGISQAVMLLGNGQGQFSRGPTLTLPRTAQALLVGDFNGDGHSDIAAPSAYTTNLASTEIGGRLRERHGRIASRLLDEGDGTGGFAPPKTIALPDSMLDDLEAEVGDFTGSGRADVLLRSGSVGMPEEIAVLPGDATAGLGPPIITPLGSSVVALSPAADMTGDGHLDLLVTTTSLPGNEASLAVLAGDGQGHFDLIPSSIAFGGTILAEGHLDETGREYALVSTTVPGPGGVAVPALAFVYSDASGHLAVAGGTPIAGWVGSAIIGDANGAGLPDIVLPFTGAAVQTLINTPPPPCVAPRLAGDTLVQARQALTAAHCSLGGVRLPRHRGRSRVVSESPAAGATLAPSSPVSVVLAYAPAPKRRRPPVGPRRSRR